MNIRKILLYLCGIVIIGVYFQGQLPLFTPRVNRALGIVMGLIMLLVWREGKIMPRVLCTEMWLWCVFILWTFITGMIVAVVPANTLDMSLFFVQLTAIIAALITIAILNNKVEQVATIIVLLSYVFLLYLIVSRQWSAIFYKEGKGLKLGDLNNANSIGMMYMNSIMCLALLIKKQMKKITRLFSFISITFFSFIILQTGSRKSAVCLALFFATAYFFCVLRRRNDKVLKRYGRYIFICILCLIMIYFLIPYVMDNTYFGTRFKLINKEGEAGLSTRLLMYDEAWDLFLSSPIWGIGLDQFRFYSVTKKYSHSNYAELLSCSGVVGFLLIISIYISILMKLFKIRKNARIGSKGWHISGVCIAMIITQLALGFGVINFTSISSWLVISLILGFTVLYDGKLSSKTVLKTKFYVYQEPYIS